MRSIANIARLTTLGLLASLFIALVPGAASACSCMPVTTEEMIAASDTVFVGQEIRRQVVNNDDAFASRAVTFRVIEAYKGEVSSEMLLFTNDNGASCGMGAVAEPIGLTVDSSADGTWYGICGSVHEPAALAALLDPIPIVDPEPAPPKAPVPGGRGVAVPLWVFGGMAVAAAAAVLIVRARRTDDWQEGWSSQD